MTTSTCPALLPVTSREPSSPTVDLRMRRRAGVSLHAKRGVDSCHSHPLWRCYLFCPLIKRPLGYKSSYNQHHANNFPHPHHAAIRPTNSHNTSYSAPFPSARMASHYIRFTAPFVGISGHKVTPLGNVMLLSLRYLRPFCASAPVCCRGLC